LQYGDTSEEQAELYAARGLRLTRAAEIDNYNDIDGLAALIDACDIVVTVSNTTAHLAAALGKPVLVMLPFSPGLLWYWHLDSEDSVWYPGARLFRQHHIGDWAGVIQRVREELACWSEH
jgi:ADP-heptose:LPS heptosyltransferase